MKFGPSLLQTDYQKDKCCQTLEIHFNGQEHSSSESLIRVRLVSQIRPISFRVQKQRISWRMKRWVRESVSLIWMLVEMFRFWKNLGNRIWRVDSQQHGERARSQNDGVVVPLVLPSSRAPHSLRSAGGKTFCLHAVVFPLALLQLLGVHWSIRCPGCDFVSCLTSAILIRKAGKKKL